MTREHDMNAIAHALLAVMAADRRAAGLVLVHTSEFPDDRELPARVTGASPA